MEGKDIEKDNMNIMFLFIISLLTRFLFLFFGFSSLTHDEADYYMNSYILAKTGSDIFSNKFFLTSGIIYPSSAVPVYLGSLFFLFLNKSIISGRLPYALLNSFIPVLFYLIVNKLTKNKALSLICFSVFNFSPWFSFLSSQSAIDSPISILFFLLSIFILLTDIKPLFKKALFVFFAFLSFNSYMGIKIVFPFFLIIAFLISDIYRNQHFKISRLIKIFLLSSLIFLSFLSLSYFAPNASRFRERLKEKIIFLNLDNLKNQVDYERRMTEGPIIIKRVFFNKAQSSLKMFLERYLHAFNTSALFLKGDSHPIYGTGYIGLFYIFDFLFLLLGLYFAKNIFKKKANIVLPFFLIFITAPLIVAISVDPPTISLRSMFLIIPYVFFIAAGWYYLYEVLWKNKLFLVFIFLIYTISFFYFFGLFQVLIKIASAEQWHYSEKILSDKLTILASKNRNIIVYVNEPKETFLLYLYYKESDASKIKKLLTKKTYTINNISFIVDCPQKKIPQSIQIMHSQRCPVNNKVFTPAEFISSKNKSGPSYLLLQ